MYVNEGSIIAIGVIFPVLGALFVGTRFAIKRNKPMGLWVDDWLCIPAWVLVTALGVIMIYGGVRHSFGAHSPHTTTVVQAISVNTPEMNLMLKLEWVTDTINPAAAGLIRLSFLFFYRRIFRGRTFNIINYVSMFLVIGWAIAFTVTRFAMCGSHVWAAWSNMATAGKYCFHTLDLHGWQGITSFMLDVMIFTTPFFWIWRLQMPVSRKLEVSYVFLCGAFVVVASALRMVAGIDAINFRWGVENNVLGLVAVNDIMGDTSVMLFWQYIETGTGLIVCCLPSLRPTENSKSFLLHCRSAYQWTFTRLSTSRSGSRTTSSSNSTNNEKTGSNITVTKEVDLTTVPVSAHHPTSSYGRSEDDIV